MCARSGALVCLSCVCARGRACPFHAGCLCQQSLPLAQLGCLTAFNKPCCTAMLLPSFVQGALLMVGMQLMLGGSLRVALADPERQDELRWGNR